MVIPSMKKSNPPGNHWFMHIFAFFILWFKMVLCFEGFGNCSFLCIISQQVKTCIATGMFSLYIILAGKSLRILIYT